MVVVEAWEGRPKNSGIPAGELDFSPPDPDPGASGSNPLLLPAPPGRPSEDPTPVLEAKQSNPFDLVMAVLLVEEEMKFANPPGEARVED